MPVLHFIIRSITKTAEMNQNTRESNTLIYKSIECKMNALMFDLSPSSAIVLHLAGCGQQELC